MKGKNDFLTAISILVGTAIGAGILGIPYVAAAAGFPVAIFYIVFVGLLMLLLNLYLGEVVLRTKKKHQLPGYAQKYLGKKGRKLMQFATIFSIYSAIVAYVFGMGQSISFLIFGNTNHFILFGLLAGVVVSGLIWSGINSLKRFEGIGVSVIIILIFTIFFTFITQIKIGNLNYVNLSNLFLPFGLVLFAFTSFFAVPEISLVLGKKKKMIKRTLVFGSILAMTLYGLFVLAVVGFKGVGTPEIATIALGSIFIFLGIFTMFTSYLSLGNALDEDFLFDGNFSKKKSWLLSSIIPLGVFVLISFFDFFSFTKILSIGGVVSGGLVAVLVLLMAKKAKVSGDRNPEYSLRINWFIIISLGLIFVLGVVREVYSILRNF